MKQKIDRQTPLTRTIGDFMALVKGLMALVFVGYCLSGITVVNPDEVGLILRMGKLVGNTPVDQVLQPGWVYAFPRPIDFVVKIPVKQIHEVKIKELAAGEQKSEKVARTLDPLVEGYCVSADENIFQVEAIVKFQISDPVKAVFGFTGSFSPLQTIINDLTVSELVKVASCYQIDGILSENKKQFAIQVKGRVQAILDGLESGLSIISLELEEVSPPVFLKSDFEEVNTAFINRRNFISEARSLSEERLPAAHAHANKLVNEAEAYYRSVVAQATADAGKFSEMLQAYNANPYEVQMEMLDNTRKIVMAALKKLVLLPGEEKCGAKTLIQIGNSGTISALPVYTDLYSEDEEH